MSGYACPSGSMHLVAAALLLASSVSAADQLSIPDSLAAPGTRLVLPVMFVSQEGTVAAIQFDVEFDASVAGVSAAAVEGTSPSAKTLYQASPAPGKLRILIAGANGDPIRSGPLLNLLVAADRAAADGSYPLTISSVIAASRDGQPGFAAAVSGSVKIQWGSAEGIRLEAAGVVNAASLIAGAVAPGEMLTLMGAAIGQPSPEADTPGNLAVFFDGTPATLFYAGENQIDLVAPYTLEGKSATRLQVTSGGSVVGELSLPVARSAPGIFTMTSDGIGQGAVLNENLTVNSVSRPAARGSLAGLLITGAGQTRPAGVDGAVPGDPLPRPLSPVAVRIGGVEAEVAYSEVVNTGAARGLVSGAVLVVCRIPQSAGPGPAVPVVVSAGTATSQPGVTLSIR